MPLCAEQTMWTSLNDSGIVAESSLSIIDNDSENDVVKENRDGLSPNANPEQPSVIKQKYQNKNLRGLAYSATKCKHN